MKARCIEKICPIAGEMTAKGLGIDPAVRAELCSSLQAIIGCAATTNWTEHLINLIKNNYYGPLAVLDLAHECGPQFEVLTHVSTAFCNAHTPPRSHVPEIVLETADPDQIISNIMSNDPDFIEKNTKKLISPWDN